MTICGSRIVKGLVLFLGLALVTPVPGRGQAASYLNHDGLTSELRSLTNSSDLAQMESMGSTRQGRDVWMVTVANRSGTPLDQRPGVLVAANLEGDHLVGSHLAVETIRYLIENSQESAVQDALANHVFYFFPRLNPDGAEAMFEGVKWDRRTNTRPWDDDNDGRTDEDGPEDLNGDGFITVMRVADPAGDYMVDPDDERLMKRADPTEGEAGSFVLYWEGTDNDGDGFINEDPPGGVDLNRNFQHEYPYWEAGSGPHMVSEPETRAIMDFAVAHRNIAAIVTFGESDNLVTPPDSRGGLADAKVPGLFGFADASNADVFDVGVFGGGGRFGGFRGFGGRGGGGGGVYLRGAQVGRDNDPSSGTRPATTVATQDVVYFEAISDAYKEITGIETVPFHRTPEGAFFQFGYFQFGVPSFSTPGWGLPEGEADAAGRQPAQADAPEEPEGRPVTPPAGRMTAGMGGARGGAMRGAMAGQARPGGGGAGGADAQILHAFEAGGMEVFSDWSAYNHPELGDVEIGGFLPYSLTNPPADQLSELGPEQGQFLVELAGMLPRVHIADTEVTAHGGGVFTVTVTVENTGFLPTSLQHGTRSRSVGPTFVQIQIDEDEILSGADKTTSVGVLAGSGSREEVTWVIQGRQGGELQILLHSQKSGSDTATVTLR
jgi:hypothetical protein